MVFESVVTDVLNKILGDYVVNLDSKQLKIGIWGGDVVLDNLKLRENALDDLDLPVQLVYGYLGKLVLNIPWKNLYGQPVIAQIEDLYLLISPKQSIAYDAEKEEKYELQTKKSALLALENAQQRELDKDKPKPDASFAEKLTAQIVNNLQVKIANVHLRYEDTTSTGKPFAFGVTLNDLEFYTTDMNWTKCYLTEQVSRVYKIAKLDSLSVYMNCNTELFSRYSSDELADLFRSTIARKELLPPRYTYVAGPITSTAKLQLNMNPEYDSPPFEIPKIDLFLEMEKLHVGLTSTQFQDILKLAENMNRMQLGAAYRKYRPFNKPYKNHYKEWWRFAIIAVLEENIRKKNRYWTWDYIKEHRQLCVQYATSFKEKVLAKKPAANLVETCNLLEQKLNLFNLVLIRKQVQLEVNKIKEEQATRTTGKAGWFGGWFGGGKKEEDDQSGDIVKKFEAAMTPEEKEKLYKAIGYQENVVSQQMPEQYEAIRMNFKLVALEVGLYDDMQHQMVGTMGSLRFEDLQTIMLLKFSMATCSVHQRPAANAISVTAGMKEMQLTGLEQENQAAPTLIASKVTDEFNLLDIFFETNPLDKRCDQRIKVLARPLQIIYDASTILHLIKVFAPPKSVNLSELEGAATAKMSNFKERSATGMLYIIDTHALIDVDIKFMPNILLVPHTGTYTPGERSLIVVSLGQLHITSKPRDRMSLTSLHDQGKGQDEILQSLFVSAYDTYQICVEDIQILVARPFENWEHTLSMSTITELHVLSRTSIIVTVGLCVVSDDPRMPKTKVDIVVPSIHFNITEDRIFEGVTVITSIPLPEGNTEPTKPLERVSSVTASRLSLTNFISNEAKKVRAKSLAVADALESDIVQYTDLEVNFALKEFSVTLYKSYNYQGARISVTSAGSVFGTPMENVSYDEFEDTTSQLDGPRGTRYSLMTEAQKVLSLNIMQLEANMMQRTFELVASAKLGAISLTQFHYHEDKESQLSVIETPRFSEEQQYLLTVSFTMADKMSPEFTTKYNSTEQLIVVNFSTLNITLHQEYLLNLMQIVDKFQRKLDDIITTSTAPRDHVANAGDIINKLTTIVEEDLEMLNYTGAQSTKVQSQNRRYKVVDSIKINVVANMEHLGLLLTCRKRPLASLTVQQFDASVIMKSSYTELNLRLKDIIVTDLNPKTIHTSILSIVGTNALNCQVVLYNLDETANYNSDDMKITADIGCMKIVFLNWFVTTVLSFLNKFQVAQQALANAGAAAADVAKQNALDAYEKSSRIKLNVKIKAPIIVVPVHSQSLQGIALDLGLLKLTNNMTETEVLNNERSPAIVDEIKLDLTDMKLSKVAILNEPNDGSATTNASMDTTDLAYGLKSDMNIMDPISFTLSVKRNLSSTWYRDIPEIDLSGRLKSIELNLFMEDYALLMSILSHNLAEGADEFPPLPSKEGTDVVAEVHRPTNTATSSPEHLRMAKAAVHAFAPDVKIYEQLKFDFKFDGVTANLMLSNDEGLARFGLYFLSVKGSKLIDGTLSTSIVLCNIQLEDTRSNTKSQITRYLTRKDWKGPNEKAVQAMSKVVDRCAPKHSYMVDITAIIKETETVAEVRVCGFDLIICIDFLLKLTFFLKVPDDLNAPVVPVGDAKKQLVTKAQVTASPNVADPQQSVKKMHLMLHIEEPDIILVESLEDFNTDAIIFNAQVELNYRMVGEKQLINGQIDALKMYMCSFKPERREATRHYILHPCMISLQGSTPEEEGLHISLKLSEIIINVSPATIELLNKAMVTISTSSAEKVAVTQTVKNYSEIWKPSRFQEREYWFIKIEQGVDALEALDDVVAIGRPKTERCVIEVPSITLVVEMGVGYYTTPLIAFDTRMNAIVSDWSGNLGVKGSLTLNMNYYNQSLAEWEPIIEQNERVNRNGEKEYMPWELTFSLDVETRQSEIDEDLTETSTNIKIHSEENLELTLSKTCLDLLGVLGEAFSQAIDEKGLLKPSVIAPYVVENDTGFDLTIDFRRGIFTLHECHMPKTNTQTMLNHSLLFQAEGGDADITPDLVKDCKISPGGRAYLQTKDLSTLTSEEDEEYNIYLKVGDITKEIVLPVTKSDQRYFPLYRDTHSDPWGILSEVRSEYGTTKINIHGVVNVHNHFTTTLKVYRKKSPMHLDSILVGEIPAHQVFHLPLHAIYAEAKELYFSLEGYEMSVQGIKWNESPTDLSYKRHIQCDPIATYETLYINAIRTKTEVFHENTNKFKLLSAYYTIHLRPPLYLRNALPIDIKVSVAGCTVRDSPLDIERNVEAQVEKAIASEELLDYGEKVVNPGDCLHLPTVKLSGRTKEVKSYLVVRLIQYLEKDWSCTTELSEDHKDVQTWTFSAYDSAAKMDIDLCVRFGDRFGSTLVTLFSPFWMINKTGLMLSYKTDAETVDVLYHPPEYNGPILISFRDKFFFDKKNATIRVDNGDWSTKIPLDVAGSNGAVTCKSKDMSYQMGVHNHLTYNSLTKVITFIPFYIATNKCEFDIELQELTRPGDPWIKIEPNAFVPIWPKNDSDNMIVARVHGERTKGFNYSEAQCTLLQLDNNKYGGINVDVQTTEGGVYITFTEYNPGDAPGLLINHTHKPIVFYEEGNHTERVLPSRNRCLYTWVDPMGPKRIIFGKNKVENDLRRDGVGELRLADGSRAFWVSFLDGLQRVLLITEIEAIAAKSESSSALQTITQSIEVRIHGIGLSVLNNETGLDIMYLGITSSGIIWEYKKPNKKRFKQMKIHDTTQVEAQYQQYQLDKSVDQVKTYYLDGKHAIDFDRMILSKFEDRTIQRTFYPGVWINMNTSPFQTQLHAKINKIQLDNQLNDCIFPVVLAPIPPPKSVAMTIELKPFVECSIVQRVVPNSNVKQFKYASMLIQEFHFKVDMLFLTAIAEMFEGTVTDEQAAKLFSEDVESIEKPLSTVVETQSQQEQKNFYDNLHLGPLKIHVSFSMAGSETNALPSILSALVQGVGVTLTDVNDVVFRLAFFEREFKFFTQGQLMSEITTHYTGQALKQLYVLVLGLDVLGNPYGLVVGLKKGVEDLFYEPFQGAIQGPGEFAEGLVLGVKSLFGHTVGGAAGAVSKITGAMGKGLAALTFDDDYQKKRRDAINKKPANFQEGIARSSKGLVMGFVDGVTGVVTKPVAGAREEGVEGFFKGLGKGAIGLVARPTAGVVDFASGSLEAVKRATAGSEDANRLRPPRFLHQDNVLRAYCLSEAQGNKMLREIEKGKYSTTDIFVLCEEIVQKHEYLLLTNHRVIYTSKNDLFGTWVVQWTYLWHEIAEVKAGDRGVEIKLKKEGKKIMGLFSSNESQRKLVLVPMRPRRLKITEIMESQRNEQ